LNSFADTSSTPITKSLKRMQYSTPYTRSTNSNHQQPRAVAIALPVAAPNVTLNGLQIALLSLMAGLGFVWQVVAGF
jgi:hypothetical protein